MDGVDPNNVIDLAGGNWVTPTAEQVLDGVTIGAGDNEIEGTLVAAPDAPTYPSLVAATSFLSLPKHLLLIVFLLMTAPSWAASSISAGADVLTTLPTNTALLGATFTPDTSVHAMTVTGTLNPTTATSTLEIADAYNGFPSYAKVGGGWYLWADETGTTYSLSTVAGTAGAGYWVGTSAVGTFSPRGTATGTAAVTAVPDAIAVTGTLSPDVTGTYPRVAGLVNAAFPVYKRYPDQSYAIWRYIGDGNRYLTASGLVGGAPSTTSWYHSGGVAMTGAYTANPGVSGAATAAAGAIYSWASDPSTGVVFSSSSALAPVVSFPTSGTYALTAAANDGYTTVTDSMTVTIAPDTGYAQRHSVLAENTYFDFPVTGNLSKYFTSIQNVTVFSYPQALKFTPASAASDAFVVRRLSKIPAQIFTAQIELVPNSASAPHSGDVFTMKLRDNSGTMLTQLAVTFGDQSGTTATALVALKTNLDSTGSTYTLTTKSTSTPWNILTIRSIPSTHKTNFSLGHTAGSFFDGVRSIEHELISASDLDYSGDYYDLEMRSHVGATPNNCYVYTVHISEDAYAQIGDSLCNNMHMGIGKQTETELSIMSGLRIPYVTKGFGGRYLQGHDATDLSVGDHWKKLTYQQGYRRIIVGNIGTNDFGATDAANETAVKAAFNTILADLSEQKTNDVIDAVVVCAIAPQGPTGARNAETITAVASTNAYLESLCSLYGFTFYDAHAWMKDGASDNYVAGYSSDGVHPDNFSGYSRYAVGLEDAIDNADLTPTPTPTPTVTPVPTPTPTPTPTPVIFPLPQDVRYGLAYNTHQSTGTLTVPTPIPIRRRPWGFGF